MLAVGAALVVAGAYARKVLSGFAARADAAKSVLPEYQTPESVDHWPRSPDFRWVERGETFRPSTGGADSPEAVRFKDALRDVYTLMQGSVSASAPVVKPGLDLAETGSVVFEALDPVVTVPSWVWGSVRLPGRIREQLDPERFVEAMAYPEIDLPMYRPLAEKSSELFLPNLNFIAQNSISLLETNQPFIESYMVGLNHEFARELLWREYPTDQRGSYFRQFWEPRGFHEEGDLDPEARKERLRDIPPLHLWRRRSSLGDHDHRELPGESEEEVVLVIRGELLKRYPNAVIYAHRAVWKDSEREPILDGSTDRIDPTKERDLHPLSESEEADPPRTLLKSPLYEAKVEPDIHFFGFDLTACEAKGGTGKESLPLDERCADEGIEWHDPGWFFVIKERPGEPRFGLDLGAGETLHTWNDAGWENVAPGIQPGDMLRVAGEITLATPPSSTPEELRAQAQDDRAVRWHAGMDAADLAYILYQVPVLVAVHAAEMLPKREEA